MNIGFENQLNMPVIALRGLVVFPGMILHFDVGRNKSVAALKEAMGRDQKIFLAAQRDVTADDPDVDGIYKMGVIARIKQMVKIPNSENMRVVVEGIQRAALEALDQKDPYLNGTVTLVEDTKAGARLTAVQEGYIRTAKSDFEKYYTMISKLSSEVIVKVMSLKDPGELADYICSNTLMEYESKQIVLEQRNPVNRLKLLCVELKKEIASLSLEIEIQEKLQVEIDKNQREYYLREEMRVIANELGEGENNFDEAQEYKKKVNAMNTGDEVRKKLIKECDRLQKMPGGSHEGTVVRNYLDVCLDLPLGVQTPDGIDLEKARKVLDREHYGLDKVKTRIVESLAVRKLSPDIGGQIICLIGPPGVGKTSIAKSLAKSMGRKYARISLGGVTDESEIRGHRRTYIGAMPGRMIAALKQVKSMNPLILLDEIDKLGNDVKGDPASALLEALDPEQNACFTDRYIDFPVDLSKVMFVTTANDRSSIPAPLLDRMEVIELYSYTHEEKFQIAKKHLIKKQAARHGLTAKNVKIFDDALRLMIDGYTREAGVRSLERMISSVMRKAAAAIVSGETEKFLLSKNNIEDILGPEKFKKEAASALDEVGTVNGLAWTSVGGTLLPIEITALDGTGKIELTGNLGDVMKESAKTAVSFVRSKASAYKIQNDFYKTRDIHIHAPESAIPKDGPSAGVAITTALISELTGTPIHHDVAMTGEISLKGKVLAIGGLKEKSMAAYRAGISKVIIPYDNKSDLTELDDAVKRSVEFFPVRTYDEVVRIALCSEAGHDGKEKKTKLIQDAKRSPDVITQ